MTHRCICGCGQLVEGDALVTCKSEPAGDNVPTEQELLKEFDRPDLELITDEFGFDEMAVTE